ncbi:MAG: hypothetical protein ACXACT_18470, partial [Candidatus Thorarchaeota archaeon]
TCICDLDLYTLHLGYFPTNLRIDVRKNLPKTAAWTAVAYGKEFLTRSDVQPHCVKLIPTN